MSDRTDQNAAPDEPETPKPYDRFESLTRRLLKVSKDDLREAEAREVGKRRTA
jgi:hypothetical protein